MICVWKGYNAIQRGSAICYFNFQNFLKVKKFFDLSQKVFFYTHRIVQVCYVSVDKTKHVPVAFESSPIKFSFIQLILQFKIQLEKKNNSLSWRSGTSLYTISCIVLSKLIYCRGCDWCMTIWHVGHVCFSSRCLTKQLLQNVCRHSVTVVASIR